MPVLAISPTSFVFFIETHTNFLVKTAQAWR
jgi:hypothetical protein